MAKKFALDQIVKVASAHDGKILGEDRENPGLYRVMMLEGPQKGKILSYSPDMLK